MSDVQVGQRQWWVGVLLVGGVVLALVGQRLVVEDGTTLLGVAAFAVAIVLFLLPLFGQAPAGNKSKPIDISDQPLIKRARSKLLFGSLVCLLVVLAYTGFANNNMVGGLWYWLVGMVYWVALWGDVPAGYWRVSYWRNKLSQTDPKIILALVLITALAIFFRAFRLDAVPIEMTSDHPEKLLDVYDVLSGQYPVFFERNTGREAFQFYLTAALIAYTPLEISHLALKVGTAIFGIITVPMTYWLGKVWYGRGVGLLAAFFLAISHWHVAITRVGLRFPFTAAFAVPALYFLLRALRHNRRNDWLAAGFVLGLGLHTYTAIRIVPVLFIALVLLRALADMAGWLFRRPVTPSTSKSSPPRHALTFRYWFNGVLSGLTALLVFLPLFRYMLDRPDMFWLRSTSRSVEGGPSGSALWGVFWGNVQNAMLMFNYKGDTVPINTIPLSPVLGWVSASFFVLGLAYVLGRLVRYRARRDVYLLVAFFLLILPSVLSLAFPQENPSVVRTGGAVPIVMIIVALPIVALAKRLWRAGLRPLAVVGIAALLIGATVDNYQWYFVEYDLNAVRSLWNASQMGEVVRAFLDSGGELRNVHHVPYPHWVDTRNIAITAGDITWRNTVEDVDQFAIHGAVYEQELAPKLYLVNLQDDESLNALRLAYPNGVVSPYDSARPGKDFVIYYVPVE